jgi:hypothetical protein
MTAGVLAREMLPDHGELRAYRLVDRPELLLEVLREADGRAWQLRLPLEHGPVVTNLLAGATPALRSPERIAFDDDGTAVLGEVPLDAGTRLAAVALVEGEEQVFALWRRERTRAGWSWTVDLALVPIELGPQLCAFARGALAQTGTPLSLLG